ncbi:unnamed protein product [Diplocarpon coronariae]|nr:hypothetical protein JHW43_003782 [Diplocarpon mali]
MYCSEVESTAARKDDDDVGEREQRTAGDTILATHEPTSRRTHEPTNPRTHEPTSPRAHEPTNPRTRDCIPDQGMAKTACPGRDVRSQPKSLGEAGNERFGLRGNLNLQTPPSFPVVHPPQLPYSRVGGWAGNTLTTRV